MKITVGWLDSRKLPRNRPQERQEAPIDGHRGLYAWVYPTGAVVFVYRYTRPGSDGERRKMRLGEYGPAGITLEEAFDRHRQAQRWLELGLDPIEERERQRQAEEDARIERLGAGTVADLIEQFVHRRLRGERWDETGDAWVRDDKSRTKVRRRPEAAAGLLGYRDPQAPQRKRKGRKAVPTFIDTLGHVKAPEMAKRQIVAFLDGIVDRGSPVTANRTYALLKQMFEWAAAKDLIPASPMAGVERPGGEEAPRKRALTAEEIRTVWQRLDTADMAEPTKLALRLLLVTGQRRGELTGARWEHFDFERKEWTIPTELLKSALSRRESPQPHVVPLSKLAIDLLGQLKAITGGSSYVLPAHASNRHSRPYSVGVLSRAVRKNDEHFGIPHWTPHDLRRTASSFMTKLGIPRLHVEKVLNHSTGDIAEVYDRHDYLPEKRIALESWGEHLSAILEGRERTILPLQRKTA